MINIFLRDSKGVNGQANITIETTDGCEMIDTAAQHLNVLTDDELQVICS